MKTWPTKKLGNLCEVMIGGTPRRGVSRYWENGNLPWVSIADLSASKKVITNTKELITDIGMNESNVKLIPRGTLLFSFKLSIGKLAFAGTDLYTNEAIAGLIIKNKERLNKNFLFYFLQQATFATAQKAVKGNTLNKAKIQNLEIPFPPLEIQKKVVKKIEELFSKISQAQSLRESAIQDTNNIVSSSLEQILHKSLGWKEFTIGELADDFQSGFACGKSNEVSDGIVHLRTHNVDLDGELNMDKVIKIPKSLVKNNAYGLKKGDILFNNTNSTELVGKTIIIREDLLYAFSNHLNRIRFNASIVMPEWILFIFQKYWRDKYFESICTRWVGQSGINQGKLVTIKVPLPPIAEQRRIVERMDALTQKVRELQKLQFETAANLTALKQSILHKAFQGELIN